MNTPRRAGARVTALAAAVASLLAGCGPASGPARVEASGEPRAAASPAAPSAAPAVSPPTEPEFTYADPQEVCRRFTAALYSADTTRDTTPVDAFARASQYTDGALAGQRAAAQRDGRWRTWAAHRARLETRVETLSDPHQSPDSTTTAYRSQKVVATPVGEDGWRGWAETSLVYCTLHSGRDGWRVADFEIYLAQS